MKKMILCAALACALTTGAKAQTIQPFRDGDRVVFLGNSITDGGHYHSYIWLYYMTRFPYMDLRVMNAGIGGETAGDMYKRLDGDVFSKRSTVLNVTFGMNDTGYAEYNEPGAAEFGERRYRECYANYEKMEQRLQGLDSVRIVLLGGAPYDETARIENPALRGKNGVLQRVVDFQHSSAEKNGWEFLDFNRPMTELAQRVQSVDSTFTLTMGDRIHPDNDGHMVMAYLYLKAQGMVGKVVAEMQIDASKRKVLGMENCRVTDLRGNGRELSFDYMAEALPYPLDTVAHGWEARRSQAEAVRLVPFIEEMNREILVVKGLMKGDYALYIDDERIGCWSAAALAEGVNLAVENTPQYRQALQVMYLNEFRWEIERNFRDYAWVEYDFFQQKGLLGVDDTHAVRVLDAEKAKNVWLQIHRENYARMMHPQVREAREAEMDLLVRKIYEINKPRLHRIILRRE